MKMQATEVDIPIFLHPHLFWVFEKRNKLKRYQLQTDLAKEYENCVKCERVFTVGEVVAVKRNRLWCRAIIKDMIDGAFPYEVWLMDYGHLYHTNSVYKLHQKYLGLPALVKQASLFNVVFIDEALSLENSSISKYKNSTPNQGATVNALQFLKEYTLFFEGKKEMKGILFGDILYKKDCKPSSLTETLILKDLMVQDEELFSNVESRICDKDLPINALRQASKMHKEVSCLDLSLLMDQVFTRTTARGLSLGGNYSESEPEEITPKRKSSKTDILRKLRRTDYRSCTESECDEGIHLSGIASEGESKFITIEKLDSVTEKTKHSKLKSLLNKKTRAVIQESEISDASFDERPQESSVKSEGKSDCDGSPKKINKLLALKLKSSKRHSDSDDVKSMSDVESIPISLSTTSPLPTDSCQKDENETPPKLLKAPNTIFLPSGIRSMTDKSKTKPKQTFSYYSDSSLSTDTIRPKTSMDKKLPNMSMKNIESSLCSSSDVTDVELKETNQNIELERKNTDGSRISHSDPDWSEPCKNKGKVAEGSNMVVKPVCNCRQCHHWSTSDDWRMSSENFGEEGKVKLPKLVNLPSLLLKGKREENIKLSSINYRTMTKLEKQASFKPLVHGRLLPTPINRITEAPFHSLVHRALKKLDYSRAKKIQSYIWPAVNRYMNVCFIHKRGSGKTLAYLPALCSFLLEKDERYNELKKGGPIITILCTSSTQCEEIYDLAGKLVEGAGTCKPKILLVTYPFEHVNMSSVDLLITIPPVLTELLKKNATNMKRLCHLVFEDISVLMEKYQDDFNSTISVVESMLSHRVIRQNVQIIMSGEHWTLKVENFAKKLRDIPLIAIGDYLEAAMYGRIKLKLKCIKEDAKRDAVVDILKDKYKYLKSIVLCSSKKEVKSLCDTLDLASISCIAITSDLLEKDICQKEANWELAVGGDYKVLVCTDQVMHMNFSITSAALLVHYSLPEKWSLLTKRFNCLLENFRSPLISDNNKLVCESHILTDGTCEVQIPRLLALLKNYNVAVNQIEPISKAIIFTQEQTKVKCKIPLCHSLKQFGYCQTERCSKRHILSKDLDSNPLLPKNGIIKFQILKLIDVNQLSVNIVEHRDVEGKITSFQSQMYLDDEKLTSLLKVQKEKVEKIIHGESYAYWDTEDFDDMFRECYVEEVRDEVAEILMKESGRRMVVCKSKIFELPEELKKNLKRDSSTTELIIANFKPPYKDNKFSARAYFKLTSIIEGLKYDGYLYVANICLQLGDTLWVSNVTEEVNVYDLTLSKSNLAQQFLKQKIAVKNEEHLKTLYGLCGEAGIILPKYSMPVKHIEPSEAPQVTPHWAFLDMDNCNKIIFTSAVTPDEMYVRLEKFTSLLTNLESDLEDIVRRQGSKRDYAILTGRYYIARDQEEDKFCRVLIKQIENRKALCFSVDYGDEFIVNLKDIRYLPNHLILKLPFQAIQCRLYGIKPINGEWTEEAIDVFYSKFSLETDSDIYRTLYAKCMYQEKGIHRGQSIFSILIKDTYEKPIIINQLLVDCGWAELFSNLPMSDFETPSEKLGSGDEKTLIGDENDEALEEIKDIFKKTKIVASNSIGIHAKTTESMNYEMTSDIEFFFGTPEEAEQQCQNFFGTLFNSAKETGEQSSAVKNHCLPAIEAAPFEVDYSTPDVYWSQTENTIQMIVKLPNVETYTVKLEKSRFFRLQTTVNQIKYALNLTLFEAVEKNFSHVLGGLEIRINLKKKQPLEWPKLSKSNKRLRNVHYMLSKEEMEDEKHKLFLDLGDELNEKCSEGEDGRMFHVVEDMDSDLDIDMEEDSDF